MKISKRHAILSSLAVAFAVLATSAMAMGSSSSLMAESSSPTDITASSPVQDCFLLFNGSDMTKWNSFNPFTQCVDYPRRYDCFDYVAARPFKEDLYTYWYFDDDNKIDLTFDEKATYGLELYVTNEDAPSSGSLSLQKLEMVGDPYHVGTQWLLKFKASGVFPSVAVGSAFGFQTSRFGKMSGSDMSDSWCFDVEEKQTFTYTDDQYDITSAIWGDKTKIVTVTKSDAFPLICHKDQLNASFWDYMAGRSGHATTDVNELANWELHGFYFDLDRSPDQILHIDIEYQMVEYYVDAVHNEWYYDSASYADANKMWLDHYPHRVPDSTEYVPNNEIEKKYEGTAYCTKTMARHADIFSTDVFDLTQARNNFWSGKKTTYTTHNQAIIDTSNLNAIQDEKQREWIGNNCVDSSGDRFKYAVFFDVTSEDWSGKKNGSETTGWWFWKHQYDHQLVRAHTCQGIYATKMTVMVGKDKLDWNVFMQPVNEKPGILLNDHHFTLAEIMVPFLKDSHSWLAKLIMWSYAILSSVTLGAVCYAMLKPKSAKSSGRTPSAHDADGKKAGGEKVAVRKAGK